ncbi:GGDEF domain-containing response regulator [Algicola sagamiensis]|uniref:GGDEF domain-containing response regulator n=1 Tax=Algicola sagamiensis TaxID=163869 RepID=UPI00037098FA|nr:diguanylate cyclase [Algicola sagamiensis]
MNEPPVVLIVDDSSSNIQIIAGCLKEDYHIRIATSGEKCLELVHDDPQPDIVLLDIEMPNMNGHETCEQLKADKFTENIPVIFITCKDSEEDEAHGFLLGGVDYITKPISPAVVKARVNTHLTLKYQRDKLEHLAMHDQLTDLYNRYYLLAVSEQRISSVNRHHQPLSVLIIDVDHFKKLNDTYGHLIGDQVLIELADVLKKACRHEDIAARFGGEEFVMVLEHCDIKDAALKAEVIRKQVEERKPDDIRITVSIGVSQLKPDEHRFRECLKRADAALYQAKASGRNQVVIDQTVFDELPTP